MRRATLVARLLFAARYVGTIHHNLSNPALYEAAIVRSEGEVGHLGPFVVSTTREWAGLDPGHSL